MTNKIINPHGKDLIDLTDRTINLTEIEKFIYYAQLDITPILQIAIENKLSNPMIERALFDKLKDLGINITVSQALELLSKFANEERRLEIPPTK